MADLVQDATLVRAGDVMHRVHVLRCWPAPFSASILRRKMFEIRRHDRDYREGDLLLLREHDPNGPVPATGRWCARKITYVLRDRSDFQGLEAGYSVLSVSACDTGEIAAAKEAGTRG